MKRSELLNRITDTIHTHRRATVGVTSHDLAEMVLKQIEEAGLVPIKLDSYGNALMTDYDYEDETQPRSGAW